MWTLNPRRPPKRSKRDPNNHLGSVQDLSPTGRMATKEISLQPWKPRGRKRGRLSNPCIVRTNMDISAKERRMLKIGVKASRLEMDPPLSTPIGKTSNRGSNHILAGDTTKEVPPTSSKVSSNGILEEFVSQMTTMRSNIIEHHERKNQCLASLEEDLAHAKLEKEKLKATIEALEKREKRDECQSGIDGEKGPLQFVGSEDGTLSDSQPFRNDWRF
ncbi:hypothetical protein R1flu_026143 [Riccia fluitans]|uniref:Uncharacterized protein n=1 Tax=Riccia fluitans TaxID=41844 RepID=A0ABD1XFK4_9MARC